MISLHTWSESIRCINKLCGDQGFKCLPIPVCVINIVLNFEVAIQYRPIISVLVLPLLMVLTGVSDIAHTILQYY